MAAQLRAVLDTNVLLAARRSSHPDSPNVEILSRWRRREFVFCYSLDTLAEYTEKLLEHGIPEAEVEAFVSLLAPMEKLSPSSSSIPALPLLGNNRLFDRQQLKIFQLLLLFQEHIIYLFLLPFFVEFFIRFRLSY